MLALAAGFCGLGVALGAFGAHAPKATLETSGHLATWQTAVQYQLIHGVALLALAVWMRLDPAWGATSSARVICRLFAAGIICFSGSLYALSLGGPKAVLGPITPIGGVFFLAGWIVLVIAAMRGTRASAN